MAKSKTQTHLTNEKQLYIYEKKIKTFNTDICSNNFFINICSMLFSRFMILFNFSFQEAKKWHMAY